MTIEKPLVVNQPEFNMLIRELRLLMGLTQEQLAAKLGVTCSSVNRWENKRSRPSKLAMQHIEEMLRQMGDRGKDLLAKYLAD